MNWASRWWVVGSFSISIALTATNVWIHANKILTTAALAAMWFFTGGIYSNYQTLRLLSKIKETK